MRSFYALVKKDLKGYFDQPTGYVLLVIFVGVSSYIFFQTALENEEASLRPLFSLFPWMLAIFVAASTMRLVAEEQRDGTLEILLTQPIRAWSVLLSKLVAALLFVGTGVVLTIGIPIALETAGDLDRGAVVAQYLGTFLLTASLVSIGLFTSSLTRNQIVAFILGPDHHPPRSALRERADNRRAAIGGRGPRPGPEPSNPLLRHNPRRPGPEGCPLLRRPYFDLPQRHLPDAKGQKR